MACASCGKNKRNGDEMNTVISSQYKYPLNANDIQVVDNQEIHRFQLEDWDNNKHKLLVFIPEAFTPVCTTEIGAMSQWYEEFQKQNCELILCASDPAPMILDWFNSEELLKDRPYKAYSTYIMASRLNIIEGGRPKRASVFVTSDGEVTVQEHFKKVGRSFAELHRMIYAYNTDSYCGEGWKDPSDGFLTENV